MYYVQESWTIPKRVMGGGEEEVEEPAMIFGGGASGWSFPSISISTVIAGHPARPVSSVLCPPSLAIPPPSPVRGYQRRLRRGARINKRCSRRRRRRGASLREGIRERIDVSRRNSSTRSRSKGSVARRKKRPGNATDASVVCSQNGTYVKEERAERLDPGAECFGLEQPLGPTHDDMAKVSSGENKESSVCEVARASAHDNRCWRAIELVVGGRGAGGCVFSWTV